MTTTANPTSTPPHNGALVEEIRQIITSERRHGRRPPGRDVLADKTGASTHHVRRALAALKDEEAAADPQPGPVGEAPGDLAASGEPVTSSRQHAGEPGEPHPPAHRQAARPTPDLTAGRPEPVPRSTRRIVVSGFLFGLVASILANWLDTWLPAAHQPPGWTPGLAPQIGSVFWPGALMFAVEVLARVHWPRRFWWGAAKYVGVGVVALGSAWISYSHVHDVLMAWGYEPSSARVGPLVIDGLMVVCGFALLAISRTASVDQRPPEIARPIGHPWRWRFPSRASAAVVAIDSPGDLAESPG